LRIPEPEKLISVCGTCGAGGAAAGLLACCCRDEDEPAGVFGLLRPLEATAVMMMITTITPKTPRMILLAPWRRGFPPR